MILSAGELVHAIIGVTSPGQDRTVNTKPTYSANSDLNRVYAAVSSADLEQFSETVEPDVAGTTASTGYFSEAVIAHKWIKTKLRNHEQVT